MLWNTWRFQRLREARLRARRCRLRAAARRAASRLCWLVLLRLTELDSDRDADGSAPSAIISPGGGISVRVIAGFIPFPRTIRGGLVKRGAYCDTLDGGCG